MCSPHSRAGEGSEEVPDSVTDRSPEGRKAVPPVAVIGVGNLLMSDEGIGIHVVRALRRRRIPRWIEIIDGGTGGLALLNVMRDREMVIIVDAVALRAPPGAVFRWIPAAADERASIHRSAHTEGIEEVLRAGWALGLLPPVVCIGIVPFTISSPKSTLSPVLRRRLPAIVNMVLAEGIRRRAVRSKRARGSGHPDRQRV